MRIFHKEVSYRRFGVELEVSNTTNKSFIGDCLKEFESSLGYGRNVKVTSGLHGWAESRSNSYWHVKYDSTCGLEGKYKDHGWEIASYVGSGARDIRQIAEAAAFLKFNGLETNQNCGLHVHVEIADFSARDMGVLMARWLKVEPYLFSICQRRRRDNVYCQSMRDRYWSKCLTWPIFPQDLWKMMKPVDVGTHNNPEKKCAINTVGYAIGEIVQEYNRKTVELRIPEGLLDPEHVRCWTTLFLNLVDSCEGAPYPESVVYANNLADLLVYMGLDFPEAITFCDPDLWGAKCWFLQKLARSGLVKMAEEAENHLDFISRI